jgi:multidrug efflux system outer membrane protein
MMLAAAWLVLPFVAQAASGPSADVLTLRAAVAEALAASPALGPAEDIRALALVRAQVAAAELSPTFSPMLTTSHDAFGLTTRTAGVTAGKRFGFGTQVTASVSGQEYGSGAAPYRDLGYAIGVSQPLLHSFAGAFTAPLVQARRDVVSSNRAYADARADLVIGVVAAFLDVMQARRVVIAAARSLEHARALRQSATARVTVGLATELDVSRADWMAAQADVTALAEQDAEADANDRLARLLGRPAGSAISIDGMDLAASHLLPEALAPPAEAADPVAGEARLVALALANRQDLREGRDRIADAERAARVAQWNLLPQINLDVTYIRHGLGRWSSPIAWGGGNGWQVGLSSGYTFNRASAGAGVAQAAIGVQAAERAARDAEARAIDEVRRATRNWRRTVATVDIQTKAVALAERQLRLAQLRYESGVAGYFDVVDAESNLYQAQTALVAAESAHVLSGLTLRRVAGLLNLEEFRP